jgi:hypothetical protein
MGWGFFSLVAALLAIPVCMLKIHKYKPGSVIENNEPLSA